LIVVSVSARFMRAEQTGEEVMSSDFISFIITIIIKGTVQIIVWFLSVDWDDSSTISILAEQ